jgi:hypothetical protein
MGKMSDEELNYLLLALEAAYDTLKHPVSAYLDQSDFEAQRQDALEKLLKAMKVMDLDIGGVSEQPVFAAVTAQS